MGSPPPFAIVSVPRAVAPYLNMYNKTHANISVHDYLLLYRGPKRLSMQVVLPITIIYGLIFLSGLVGNTLVCVVIWRNKSMHTATNFYLFSLAFSDLTLLLLGLPYDLSVFWQQYPWLFGEVVCKLRALASETSSYSSVLVIVAFSTERYLAVCQPFKTYQISTLKRARRVIAAIWALSLLAASPFAYFTIVNYLQFPPGSGAVLEESAFCAMLLGAFPYTVPVYEVSTVLFFFIPLVVIGIMYWKIFVKLQEREGQALRRPGRENHKRATVRMLGTVVLTFFLCWAPFHLQRLFIIYMTGYKHYQVVNEYLYYVTGCFYFFSSTVNPILYSLMSVRFREAFKRSLGCADESTLTTSRPRQTVIRLADRNGNTTVSQEPNLIDRPRQETII